MGTFSFASFAHDSFSRRTKAANSPRRSVRVLTLLACFVVIWASLGNAQAQSSNDAAPYYPSRHEWQQIKPEQAGFDSQRLQAAVTYAQRQAVTEPNDLHQVLLDSYTDREPNYRVLGPTAPREVASGIILKGGRIVTAWGDVERVDMTFSVVKSYLSSLVGLAEQQELIEDLHKPVFHWVQDGSFDSAHNRDITWHHLLQQTSDWQGTLWDTPDWADRPVGDTPADWPNRPLNPPGSFFKYNDVRVNLLAYSLLQVWREPLPQVLKREIMDPIGASTTWRWHGYENSWVTLDGQRMQSVSGGGHFGGGLFINTLDHARYGLLFLRQGRWQSQQILNPQWIQRIREPATPRPDYGYMWWLNTDQKRIPEAPASAYWAAGFGGNYIYIDEENDLVVVLRWIPKLEEVIAKILAAQKQ